MVLKVSKPTNLLTKTLASLISGLAKLCPLLILLITQIMVFHVQELAAKQNSAKQSIIKRENSCDEKLTKKDAADIVIRQLTPYYNNHRFESKVCQSSAVSC